MVLTAGSTGDVEPFAALAAQLASRGHAVTFATDARFSALAPGNDGVGFAPIRADFRSLLPTPDRKKPSLRQDVFPVIRGMLEDSWTVAKAHPPDAIVAHEKTLAAPHVAEKLGIPHMQALTVPMLTPTRAFPLPGVVNHDLGGVLNRASYRLLGLLTRPYAGLIRDWRDEHLSLAPRGRPPRPPKRCTAIALTLCRRRMTGRRTRSRRAIGLAKMGMDRLTPSSKPSSRPANRRSTSASEAASVPTPFS